MYLVAIGWFYIVVLMAAAEALSSQGTVLGALITFLLYGVLPCSIVLYVMGAPKRRDMRRRQEAEEASEQADGGGHAAADAGPAVGKEP